MGSNPSVPIHELLNPSCLCVRCWDQERKEAFALFIYRGHSICKECLTAIEKWETKVKGPWTMHLSYEKDYIDSKRRKSKTDRPSDKSRRSKRNVLKASLSGRRSKNAPKKSS